MPKDDKYRGKFYLEEYLKYYDRKSIICKRWYSVLIGVDIILSSFIPFAALFFDVFSSTKYIVALMGSLITIASTFRATFGFHDNWIEYRTTAEILKYHKYLYETKSSPYNDNNKEELLIVNVNSIFSKENKTWRSINKNIQKKPSNK